MSDFMDAVTGEDRRAAYEALIHQLAAKLDAGLCKYCGGPKGEAAGMAALTLRLMKVYEALDALPREDEESRLDEITRNRYDRRHGNSNSPHSPHA